jgi:hypothetical protein
MASGRRSCASGEEQVATLKKAGASDKLIAAMQAKGRKAGEIGDVTDFVLVLDCSGSMTDAVEIRQNTIWRTPGAPVS